MKRLLIVEDQAKDALNAAKVAESLGFGDVEAIGSVRTAISSLEMGVKGEKPLPDAIVLDLDLGVESGFELLRSWYSSPVLNRIPLFVWSIVEEQRRICELFKVKAFVPKWDGVEALRHALAGLAASSASNLSAGSGNQSPSA